MLASYGIETAVDIDRDNLLKIPGIGHILATQLVNWRQHHEANFRFNPNEPVDPRDLAALLHDLQQREQALIAALRDGPSGLRRISTETLAARQRLTPALDEAWRRLKPAEAERQAL